MEFAVRPLLVSIYLAGMIGVSASVALAQTEIPTEQVMFEPGASSATVKGTIVGDGTLDYVVNARAGQIMTVNLTAESASTNFNVLPPKSDGEAIFIGSTEGASYSGALPADGDYKVRVYLMGNAADTGASVNFNLDIAVADGAAVADALVEGTNFNATGEVPCRAKAGANGESCAFGVIRTGNGSGTVVITNPAGLVYSVTFDQGTATGYDGESTFSSSKAGDVTTLIIGEEEFDIPDAVVFGG